MQGVVVSIQSIECGLGLKGLLLSSGIWSSIRNVHDWLLARVCVRMCKNTIVTLSLTYGKFKLYLEFG